MADHKLKVKLIPALKDTYDRILSTLANPLLQLTVKHSDSIGKICRHMQSKWKSSLPSNQDKITLYPHPDMGVTSLRAHIRDDCATSTPPYECINPFKITPPQSITWDGDSTETLGEIADACCYNEEEEGPMSFIYIIGQLQSVETKVKEKIETVLIPELPEELGANNQFTAISSFYDGDEMTRWGPPPGVIEQLDTATDYISSLYADDSERLHLYTDMWSTTSPPSSSRGQSPSNSRKRPLESNEAEATKIRSVPRTSWSPTMGGMRLGFDGLSPN